MKLRITKSTVLDPQINKRLTISVKRAAINCMYEMSRGGRDLENSSSWLLRYFIILIAYLTSDSMWMCKMTAETNLDTITMYPSYVKIDGEVIGWTTNS